MLVSLMDDIKKQIAEYAPTIMCEEIELLGENKISVTISTSHLMGSIEILDNLTTDLLIVETGSEDIIDSSIFESVNDSDGLKEIISSYLIKVVGIEQSR